MVQRSNPTRRHIVIVGATLLVLLSATRNPTLVRLIVGFLLLFLAGEAPPRTLRVTALIALGAWLVAANIGIPLHQRWAAPLAFVAIVATAIGAPEIERRLSPGAVWLLVLATIGGIYSCVPETGHLQPLAVLVGLLAVFEAATTSRVPPGLLCAGAGVLGWSVAYGGTYRSSALVGGFASFGILTIAPLLRFAARPGRPNHPHLGSLLLVGVQGLAALGISRTAGLATTSRRAVQLAVPELCSITVVTAAIIYLARLQPPDDSDL